MKRLKHSIFLFGSAVILFACAPVLDRSLLREAEQDVSFRALRENPGAYKGKLYVLGGVVVETNLTAEGTVLEAMHVPVDRRGYFEDRGRTQGRFLAIAPPGRELMDPEVFSRGRRVTIAGRFTGLRKDRIDEMEYTYPVFEIEQFHLWPRERRYYPSYYYDPWFYPYPYYYWDPWWRFPSYGYYYNDYYYRWGPPIYRRPSPPGQPPSSRAPLFKRPERPGLPKPEPRQRQERR